MDSGQGIIQASNSVCFQARTLSGLEEGGPTFLPTPQILLEFAMFAKITPEWNGRCRATGRP